MVKQIVGLLAIRTVRGYFVKMAFQQFAPGIIVTPRDNCKGVSYTIIVISRCFVAVSSVVAASLALIGKPKIVSDPMQQLLDVMIKAEIATSLILRPQLLEWDSF